MRIFEPRGAADECDPIAPELRSHHRHLALDDGENAALEVRERDSILDGVVGPVERPLAEASQVEDRLAQRLARDGAAVETDAADRLLAVNNGDVLAELRGGDGTLLPGGSAPDHDEIIALARHSRMDRDSPDDWWPRSPRSR